jgi:beta-phosphoglucomutase family hydrolase
MNTAESDPNGGVEGADMVQWTGFGAVLFDLDGVLTPTAEVHERAWAAMFDEFLTQLEPTQPGFTNLDYLTYVDGKPRFDGVRSFLASRGIVRPDGATSDPPGFTTVGGLGNRKNQLFADMLRRDGIAAYPGSLALLDLLEREGVPMAVVSSSRNAPEVLRAAHLSERFTVVVDGNVAEHRGLAGKPAPDMFLEAAELLDVRPERCVVVEDAVSGVAAGSAGGFAFVLGVDRGSSRAALLENGADRVVDDLAETIAGGPR